jgi:Leucine-rich repeat (LRR) protein
VNTEESSQRRTQRKRRRWLQFSLRAFLLVTLAVGVGLGWLGINMDRARRQKRAVEFFRDAHEGWTIPDPQIAYTETSWDPPVWLRTRLGEDFFRRVKSVKVWSTKINDADLAHLRVLADLESLEIVCPNVTDAGITHLRGLHRLERLYLGIDRDKGTWLSLIRSLKSKIHAGPKPAHITDEGMSTLSRLDNLKTLYLNSDEVTDAGIEHLASLDDLEDLYLRCPRATVGGLKHLAELPRLRQLDVEGIRVQETADLDLPRFSSLKHLTFGARVSEGGRICFHTADSLERLTLINMEFDGCATIDLSNAEGIDCEICGSHIPTQGSVTLIVPAGSESISCGGLKIEHGGELVVIAGDEGKRVRLRGRIDCDARLACVGGCPVLKQLDLTGGDVAAAAFANLESLGQLEELRTMCVRRVDPLLAQLNQLEQLRLLHLNYAGVTDRGLAHLATNTQLEELYLSGTGVSDKGVAHLAGLTRLQRLNLHSGKITDAGLAELANLTELRWLDLNNTQVTDAGLVHLEGMTQLERLILDGTPVTKQGVQNLQKQVPACKISR